MYPDVKEDIKSLLYSSFHLFSCGVKSLFGIKDGPYYKRLKRVPSRVAFAAAIAQLYLAYKMWR